MDQAFAVTVLNSLLYVFISIVLFWTYKFTFKIVELAVLVSLFNLVMPVQALPFIGLAFAVPYYLIGQAYVSGILNDKPAWKFGAYQAIVWSPLVSHLMVIWLMLTK